MTSLGFSAIEEHWNIRSLHQFEGVYATKQCKNDVPGVLVTLIPGILRGWAISFYYIF